MIWMYHALALFFIYGEINHLLSELTVGPLSATFPYPLPQEERKDENEATAFKGSNHFTGWWGTDDGGKNSPFAIWG